MSTIPTSSYTPDNEPRIAEGSIQNCKLKLEAVPHPVPGQKFEIQRLEPQLAPIHCLIDDILLEIFIDVVRTGTPLRMSSDERHPAVTLSRVCSRWRSLALSSPSLWTEFEIDLEDDPRCKYLGQGPDSFLSLSLSLPLNVFIYGTSDVRIPQGMDRVRMVADALLQSVARWKVAKVVLPWPAKNPNLWRLLQCTPASYTHLETLKISVNPQSWSDGTVVGQSRRFDALAILHTPAMRNITIDGWSSSWAIPSSWRNLRELTAGGTDRASLFSLISNCPNLSKLTVTIYEFIRVEDPNTPIEDRVHANLKALFMLYKISSPISLLFMPKTPALQTLSVVREVGLYCDFEEEEDVLQSHASLLHIIQSCSSSLVDLTLHYCVFHETDLIRILQLVTNLEHLDLAGKGYALTPNVFMRLSPVPVQESGAEPVSGSVVLCPNLISIKLRVREDDLSKADERIKVTFSLIARLIARGTLSFHILSEVWSTVESEIPTWKSTMPEAALDEASMRQSTKDEVEQRIREMRADLDIRRLRLERYDDREWTRHDLIEDRFGGHGARLVGHDIVYERD